VDKRVELSDSDIEQILMTSCNNRENMRQQQFQAGGTDDLVDQEEPDLTIVLEYLPQPSLTNSWEES